MGRGFKEPAISVQAAIFLDPNAEVIQVDAFGGDEVTFPVKSVERDAQEGIPSYHVWITHEAIVHRSDLFADEDAPT